MATSETQVIANCASAVEAEQIRGLLEEFGVWAFVDGANTVTALAYVGTALGGVRVVVRTRDAERAMEILESARHPPDESAAAWYCGPCEEEIDGGFDVCWSCGQSRDEVQRPFPTPAAAPPHVAPNAPPELLAPGAAGDEDANPYASPRTAAQLMATHPSRARYNNEAEAILLRAWRASILGTMFFPFIAHFYSMCLLVGASMTADTFSPAGNRRYYGALTVNLIVAACAALSVYLMLR